MLNPANYAQDYAKLHDSYTRQAYPIFKRMLDTHTKKVAEYALENGLQVTGAVLAALIDSQLTYKAFEEVYVLIGVRHARNYSRLLDRLLKPQKQGFVTMEQKAVGFSSEFWRTIMAQYFRHESSGRVVEVDQTTIDDIRRHLSDAQGMNLSTFQQSRYLYDQLSNPNYNAARALTIARTESTVASNTAAYNVAEEADFELNKGWSVRNDGRERHSHRVVGAAEPIPQNALFEVPSPKGDGMEYARFPGDVTLSAGNTVNCRCAVYSVPVYDEYGLPVPRERQTRPAAAAAMGMG